MRGQVQARAPARAENRRGAQTKSSLFLSKPAIARAQAQVQIRKHAHDPPLVLLVLHLPTLCSRAHFLRDDEWEEMGLRLSAERVSAHLKAFERAVIWVEQQLGER